MNLATAIAPTRGKPTPWWRKAFFILAALAITGGSALAHKPGKDARLPTIGPAPEFTLTNQEGKPFSLRDLRGKVAVVTFIFTTCSDTCPLLTAKLIGVQKRLGPDQSKVFFTAVTVDPLNDTPPVLKKYAQAHSADLSRFYFLTGSMGEIEDVTRRYAIFQKKQPSGSVDHTFLTSIVDQAGMLRVQYLGVRFDPKEFLGDLKSVLAEAPRR